MCYCARVLVIYKTVCDYRYRMLAIPLLQFTFYAMLHKYIQNVIMFLCARVLVFYIPSAIPTNSIKMIPQVPHARHPAAPVHLLRDALRVDALAGRRIRALQGLALWR